LKRQNQVVIPVTATKIKAGSVAHKREEISKRTKFKEIAMLVMMRWMLYAMVLCAAIPAFADETVMVKAGFMSLDARGNFGASASGLVATPIQVDSTVPLSRSNQASLEAAVQWGDFRVALNYFPLRFNGDAQLTTPVQFNGQTYASGDKVHADFKADVLDASLTYYVLNFDDTPARFQLGVEASVKTVYASSTLQNSTTGISKSKTATVPIPTLGARGRIALSDFIGLTGRAGYLGYAGNHFLDSEVQIEFSPLPTVGIYAGYRLVDLKLDRSGVLLDMSFSGPVIGGVVRF